LTLGLLRAENGLVTNILIQGIPEHLFFALEARARELEISPAEFALRCVQAEVLRVQNANSRVDWSAIATAFPDLLDESAISRAWS
jgi:hypothetical protein